ncbi:P-loop NTPase family protein [Granulicella tundricola]|nr:hypothetical protein [Granulicella tundricola]
MKTLDAPSMYQGLLHRIVERSNMDPTRGLSLAITSVNHGEGVSYVTKTLASALETMLIPKVLHISLSSLETVKHDPSEIYLTLERRSGRPEELPRLSQQDSSLMSGLWHRGMESRSGVVQHLCTHSNVVLIDCPPLREDNNTLSVAPVVDGVILVVQAGGTTTTDILFAERKIVAAGGTFEGYVLNKAQTVMPKWFYKHFAKRTR